MARMYPQELSNEKRRSIPSYAEIVFYDALATSLSDEWTVFFSIPWQQRTSKGGKSKDGETDFIVAHPDLGALVIEVKGGQIRFDGDLQSWVTTDANGIDHKISPFEQARRCKHSLRNYLTAEDDEDRGFPKSSIHDAVAFPQSRCDVTGDGLPLNAPREMIVDCDDLKSLEASLRSAFAYHRGVNARQLQGGAQLLDELVRRLGMSLTLPNPLALSLPEEEIQYVRLTEQQVELLYSLKRFRKVAVCGCAGSGKTMLAMEKARQLAQDGFRTLLTCFNKGLSSYLAERAEGIEGLTVAHYHLLCHEFARQADVDWVPGRDSWETAPDALIEAVERHPELKFDAVIVDEAQDFRDTWWVSVLSLQANEDDGILYVFYDDNQQVYRVEPTLPADLEVIPLTSNVRNTRAIFRCVAPLYQGEDEVRPRGPSGRTVEPVAYPDAAQLEGAVSRVVHRLVVEEQIKPQQIIVLTPRGRDRSQLGDVTKLATVPATWDDEPAKSAVRITTIHSFKGLERPVVIACELDDAFLERNDYVHLAYVAFSRPQHHLVVVGTPPALKVLLPAQLSGVTQ